MTTVLAKLNNMGVFNYSDRLEELVGFYSMGRNPTRIVPGRHSYEKWVRCFSQLLGCKEVQQRAPQQFVRIHQKDQFFRSKELMLPSQRSELQRHQQMKKGGWSFRMASRGREEAWELAKLGHFPGDFEIPFFLFVDFAAAVLRDEMTEVREPMHCVPQIPVHALDCWNDRGMFVTPDSITRFQEREQEPQNDTPPTRVLHAVSAPKAVISVPNVASVETPATVSPPAPQSAIKALPVIPPAPQKVEQNPLALLLAHLQKVVTLSETAATGVPEVLAKRVVFLRHAIDEMHDDGVEEVQLGETDSSTARRQLEELHEKLKLSTQKAIETAIEELRRLEAVRAEEIRKNLETLAEIEKQRAAIAAERAELTELGNQIEARRTRVNEELRIQRETIKETALKEGRDALAADRLAHEANVRMHAAARVKLTSDQEQLTTAQQKLKTEQSKLKAEQEKLETDRRDFEAAQQTLKQEQAPQATPVGEFDELLQSENERLEGEVKYLTELVTMPWQEVLKNIVPTVP